MPSADRLREGVLSITVKRAESVSSGQTGLGQRTLSTPGDARLAHSLSSPSTKRRMNNEVVCHPLATSSPKWRVWLVHGQYETVAGQTVGQK